MSQLDEDQLLIAAKQACRRESMLAREALSEDERTAKSLAIWRNFLAAPELETHHHLLLYAHHGSEVHTIGLVEDCLNSGREVSLPVVLSDSPHLELRRVTDVDRLAKGAFGIMVPPDAEPAISYEEIDIVVIPGLGFDREGWRVGYGGGFYDRLLSQSYAMTVGFAFDCQILPAVPTECHDEQLNMIVTENELIRNFEGAVD